MSVINLEKLDHFERPAKSMDTVLRNLSVLLNKKQIISEHIV